MTAENQKIVLGTRGSELARAQARLVEKAIQKVRPQAKIETKTIATQGDKASVDDPQAGRKGMFTAAIERVLLAGEVDVAVHSAKDLPSETSPEAEIAAVLSRAPMDDVLVSKQRGGLASLPHGATVATGNVPTRLRKLSESEWDAIVLARAGLERLGLSPIRTEISFEGMQFFLDVLPCEIFLPAGGQGVIALQVRANDQSTKELVGLVNDRETLLCLQAEREFLRGLQGDCNCPVGVLAKIDKGRMKMRAQVFLGESAAPREAEVEGACDEGGKLAGELLRRITQE